VGAPPVRLLRSRPDVILSEATADTGWFRDVPLILLCRAFGRPVVIHWHGAPDSPRFPGRSRWRQWLFRFGARQARAFVLLADPFVPYFERFLERERLVVVPNFTDRRMFSGGASAPNPPVEGEHRPVRLLFVGRVGPLKGTDVLFEAIARVRRTLPGLRAVYVGAGETETTWREAESHPLVTAGIVRLVGPLGPERALEYQAADFFVLPTRTAMFPISILEAMASGLPVIASDVGAVRWVLEDGACGIVVPPGDVEALAAAIARLADDSSQAAALGARGRARQKERFDVEVIAGELDRILARATGP